MCYFTDLFRTSEKVQEEIKSDTTWLSMAAVASAVKSEHNNRNHNAPGPILMAPTLFPAILTKLLCFTLRHDIGYSCLPSPTPNGRTQQLLITVWNH